MAFEELFFQDTAGSHKHAKYPTQVVILSTGFGQSCPSMELPHNYL